MEPGITVYSERSHLIALLSRLFSAHAYEASDKEPGFTYVVCIHFPWGQASWHVSDEDFALLFGHLAVTESDWDGHTTEAKYEAMREAVKYRVGIRCTS